MLVVLQKSLFRWCCQRCSHRFCWYRFSPEIFILCFLLCTFLFLFNQNCIKNSVQFLLGNSISVPSELWISWAWDWLKCPEDRFVEVKRVLMFLCPPRRHVEGYFFLYTKIRVCPQVQGLGTSRGPKSWGFWTSDHARVFHGTDYLRHGGEFKKSAEWWCHWWMIMNWILIGMIFILASHHSWDSTKCCGTWKTFLALATPLPPQGKTLFLSISNL